MHELIREQVDKGTARSPVYDLDGVSYVWTLGKEPGARVATRYRCLPIAEDPG
jgi:hypothetical protein